MSPAQKRKDTMLKKKYDKSDMKQNMIDQYGKEEGTKIYFATIRKQAMKEELDSKDKPFVKKLVGKLRKGSKTHAKQADDLEKAMNEESNPRIPRKEGQPANSKKHSDLYTDENPKGTIHGLGFKDVATAKASVAKIKKSSRSHAHKIQAAIAMEQRARVMGKTSEAAVFRKFINSMKKKTKQMNEAKGGDHEVAMAQSQLKKSEENIKKLRKALGKKEKDIPAWMQAKITDTAHDTDAAAGYVDKMNEGTLHKWFKGSKSKDGKGGWVNVTTGGTCASDEPGEGVPKCVSRSKYESMTPAERKSASRRKKSKDRGQQSKRNAAKPTYVATDKPKKKMKESYSNWRQDLQEKPGDGYLGPTPIPNPIRLAQDAVDATNRKSAEKVKRINKILPGSASMPKHTYFNKGPSAASQRYLGLQNSYQPEGEVVEGYDDGDVIRPTDRIRMKDGKLRTLKDLDAKLDKKKGVKEEFVEEGKDIKGKGSGTKDACYHKVKSRYSVWPSAYASGALVKCRKVGAANWGNKTKKEGFSDWREDMLLEGLEDKLRQMSPEQIEDLIKANKGAEAKIRKALKNMRTPKSQGPGVQLPNVPKQPASTSSATPRETYKKGGSDRVSYQRRPRPAKPSAPKPKVGLAGKVLKTLSKVKNPRVAAMLGLGALSAGMIYKGTQGIRKQMRDYKESGRNQTGYDYIMKGQQNEGYDVSNWKDDFQATEYETVDIIKPEPLQPTQSVIDEAGKKCWKGYKKAGTQKLFGKTYNRCVKAHFSDWRADMDLQEKKAKKDYDGDGKIETGEEEYKGSRDKAIKKAIAMKEDWQKSNRKDGVDGMSQKSVDAYKRENPGSKLQTAVTEKKPTGKRAKRRTSFCARSKGQKDMHNIDCTKTPEKKICKARKRWRC